MDRDRYRARDPAEAYVEELGKLVNKGSTSSARRERIFLEETIRSVKSDLDASGKDGLVCISVADRAAATRDFMDRQTSVSRGQRSAQIVSYISPKPNALAVGVLDGVSQHYFCGWMLVLRVLPLRAIPET
jgi:hypothetical protein